MIERIRSIPPPLMAVIIAAAFALVLAIGWFALVTPTRDEAAQLQREIDATRVVLETPVAAARAEERREQAEEDTARLLRAMPDRVEMPGVVLDLHRLAGEAGVRLDSIAPGAPAALGTYQSQPIAITLQGSFFAFSDFLRRLRGEARVEGEEIRGDGRIYSVDSITFAEGLQKLPSLTATLTVSTVFAPVAPAAEEAPSEDTQEVPADAAAETP